MQIKIIKLFFIFAFIFALISCDPNTEDEAKLSFLEPDSRSTTEICHNPTKAQLNTLIALAKRLRREFSRGDCEYLYEDLKEIDRFIFSAHENITDLSPLKSLTQIKLLFIDAKAPLDVTPLNAIFNLEDLTILSFSTTRNGKPVTVIGFDKLTNLSQLKELSIKYSGLSNLNFLSDMKNISRLSLSDNKIVNIESISNLRKLEELRLSLNNISDIKPVQDLTNLKELRFIGNHDISNIDPLSNLVNLTTLVLSGNSISDISPLRNLTQLEDLRIKSNNVRDITPLSNLKKLKKLSLLMNSVSDITPLAKLYNLEDVSLGSNQITDFSILKDLPKLDRLYTYDNPIKECSPKNDIELKTKSCL